MSQRNLDMKNVCAKMVPKNLTLKVKDGGKIFSIMLVQPIRLHSITPQGKNDQGSLP